MESIKPNSKFFTPRLLLILSSALLAALLIFLFIPRNNGAFRAVPAQTSLLFECNSLVRAKLQCEKYQQPQWGDLLHSAIFKRCFEDADAAIALFKHDPAILRAFAKNKALVAFSLHPADSLHALFALELDENFDLEKGLKTNKLTPKYFPHTFHGNDIFNVHLSKTERLEVAVSGKILLFSRRATLIEDALAQLENAHNWWTDRPYISELGEAPMVFHVRPAALAEQWRNQMDARWRNLPDLLARNLTWFGLSWDGKTLKSLAETNGVLCNLNAWGDAHSRLIFNVLPDNTAFMIETGLSNAPDFFEQIGSERSSDFERYVLPWVGSEAALVITEPLSPALTADRLLVLAVRDSALAVQKLLAFGKERGMLPGITGAYQMFELMGFQNSSLLKPLLEDDEAFRNPVCTLVDGYVIFAPDRSSLEILLDKYLVNQTLSTHTDLLQMLEKLPGKGKATVLLNAAYLPGLLRNLFQEPVDVSFIKPGFIGAELQPGYSRETKLTFSSQPLSTPLSETDILWKAVFAKPVLNQPFLISQPDGKTFVLVQDIDHKLHCLSAQNGAETWNRALSNAILSNIRGVDFYGNDSKCYSFSTATHLYIVDENGRDVQGFPFKLLAPATNGATVVDFDESTKFNSFVACNNGKIYGFGHLGKPLDGWNGIEIKGVVKQPILHFQHKSKDYLAVLTEDGLLSVFGRDGTLRFEPVQLNETGEKAQFASLMRVDTASTSPRIYCANSNGKLFACDLLGRVIAQEASKPGSVAAFGQLIGDAQYEWAVYFNKTLRYGNWGDKGGARTTPQYPGKKALLFFPKDHYVGLVDPWARRVWLLDQHCAPVPGFPLGGNTAFEFGQLNGVKMLVVGNGNGVWAYRMR